ncbi:MAG: carboxypeptidase-like regulatory domain-containing protein [Bryobacteraceae bacterium]
MKRKKKPTKIGASTARRTALVLLLTAGLAAADKKKGKKLAAVIAGTVFRDPGFAVAGAAIELIEVRTDGKKARSRKSITDGRGEFAFQVPPAEQRYKVKASAKGLLPEEKEATAAPGVRMDVFFTLKPATP